MFNSLQFHFSLYNITKAYLFEIVDTILSSLNYKDPMPPDKITSCIIELATLAPNLIKINEYKDM